MVGDGKAYEEYVNIPPHLGLIISSRMATIAELTTVLGGEDVCDILEILTIDGYNRRLAQKEG